MDATTEMMTDGMTDDEEITVCGFIDADMNVLVKFQYIGDDMQRL